MVTDHGSAEELPDFDSLKTSAIDEEAGTLEDHEAIYGIAAE
ncbi:hypothetical protein [Rhizobium sp. NFR07]|nr:hypothetical protein [Rhizobium sp. NFR07]